MDKSLAKGSGARALICVENHNINMYEFSLLNLDSGQLKQQHLKLRMNPANNQPIFMDVSERRKYFVAITGRNMYFNIFGANHVKYVYMMYKRCRFYFNFIFTDIL